MFCVFDVCFDLVANRCSQARRIVRRLHRFDNARLHAGDLRFKMISIGFEFLLMGKDKIGFSLLARADRVFELKTQSSLQLV